MPFLGQQPVEGYKTTAKQTITGDGSTSYTLDNAVTNGTDLEVFVNSVRQEPGTDYSAFGNTITFTTAVESSDSCWLVYQGRASTTTSIESDNLADGSVTMDKLASSGTLPALDGSALTGTGASTISNDDTATYSDGDHFVSATGVAYRLLNDGTESGWYSLADGIKATKPGLQSYDSLSVGQRSAMYINQSGELYTAGYNYYGQLGLGDTTNRTSWTQVNISDVVKVVLGPQSTFVIKSDGSLWACGANTYGQLGDGSNTDTNSFVQVISSGVSDVKGHWHTLVLKTDGSVWASGRNDWGQHGDGTTSNKNSFVQVVSSGVTSIAAFQYGSSYINSSGAVYGCGRNEFGELGDGTTTQRTTWTASNITSGASKLASGFNAVQNMVIKSDGSLWVAGENGNGQLGLGDYSNRSSFTEAVSSGVESATFSYNTSRIVKSDGSLWVTGQNNYYELGLGDTTQRTSFTQAVSSGVSYAQSGEQWALYIKDDDTILGVGRNSFGQFGLGDTTQRNSFTDTGVTDAIATETTGDNKTVSELT